MEEKTVDLPCDTKSTDNFTNCNNFHSNDSCLYFLKILFFNEDLINFYVTFSLWTPLLFTFIRWTGGFGDGSLGFLSCLWLFSLEKLDKDNGMTRGLPCDYFFLIKI